MLIEWVFRKQRRPMAIIRHFDVSPASRECYEAMHRGVHR